MGAGKTTVGSRCAARLVRDFVDTDDLVVAHAGPIDEIFAHGGEARFRELEKQVVADVCASPAPLVIACGGGTVLDPDNRRRLRDAGTIVWLRAPVDVLTARVGAGAGRPLLAGDPRAALSRLAAAREAAYEATAHAVVDTESGSLDDVCDRVLDAFTEVCA
jgi:shikimate kinase